MQSLDKVNTIDISVIMTVHKEGRLVHRSINSFKRALNFAHPLRSEFIIIIDKPSIDTRNYFQAYPDNDILEYVEYGDLGPSRNHGVNLAKGKYVAFVDADDLVCENWFKAAYDMLEAKQDQKIILHPEYLLFFGDMFDSNNQVSIRKLIDSSQSHYSDYNLIEHNLWSSLCFTDRLLMKAVPYRKARSGFGFEDWDFNLDSIVYGARHKTVEKTVHFTRLKKTGSLDSEKQGKHSTLSPSVLFDQSVNFKPVLKNINYQVVVVKNYFKQLGRLLKYNLTWLYRILMAFKLELIEPIFQKFRPGYDNTVPDWLFEEWYQIHNLEPQLYPYDASIIFNQLSDSKIIDEYFIFKQKYKLNESVTVLTELKHLNHCFKYIAKLATKVNVIITDFNQNLDIYNHHEYQSLLNTDFNAKNINLIFLGNMFYYLDENSLEKLLLRVLLQMPPELIVNFNSQVAYKLFIKYTLALAQQSNLKIAFIDCYTDSEEISNFSNCLNQIDEFICLNMNSLTFICKTFGLKAKQIELVECYD